MHRSLKKDPSVFGQVLYCALLLLWCALALAGSWVPPWLLALALSLVVLPLLGCSRCGLLALLALRAAGAAGAAGCWRAWSCGLLALWAAGAFRCAGWLALGGLPGAP